MRKVLFLSFAIVPLLLSGVVMGYEVGVEQSVTIDEEDAGTWEARTVVRDLGDQCRYQIKWSNGLEGAALRTRRCEILENKSSNHFECEENKLEHFPTSIELGRVCRGFDSFLQEAEVDELTAAEFSGGIAGAIMLDTSEDLQSFEVM